MFSTSHIIESGGLLLIAAIIFAESGMLVGFFFPGDTLLFTAGFFAGQGKLPLGWLIIIVILCAIAGCNTGYTIGKHAGRRLFRKPDGLVFRQSYMLKAEGFYERHGGKTILFACFVPVARTFVPMVAGVANMPHRKFVAFNVVGAALWATTVIILGDFLGKKIPNIDRYLLPVIALAMLISFGPMLWHFAQALLNRKKNRLIPKS